MALNNQKPVDAYQKEHVSSIGKVIFIKYVYIFL